MRKVVFITQRIQVHVRILNKLQSAKLEEIRPLFILGRKAVICKVTDTEIRNLSFSALVDLESFIRVYFSLKPA